MKATIDSLIAQLTEFKSATTDLESVKAQHEDLTGELDTVSTALTNTKAELANAQSGLSVAQVKNLKQFQSDIFTRTKELESVNAAIKSAKGQLDTLQVEIEAKVATHKQIEDSLTSLRKQHFG